MAISRNSTDYGDCVANCKELFEGNNEALVACINRCAIVNAPTDRAVSVNQVSRQIQAESKKIGQRELLRAIQGAARAALVDFPDDAEIKKMNPAGRLIVNRICTQLTTAAKASEWSTSQIENFAGEMAWIQRIVDLNVAYLINNGGNTAGNTAVDCRKQYDDCLNDHNCDDSGWFCICCIPCSIVYMRCLVGKFSSGLFGLSITIAHSR